MTKKPTPPSYLSADSKAFWRRVVSEFDFTSGGELAVLTEIASSLDRVAECRKILGKEGLCVKGDRGNTIHPAARLETQHRNLILTGCRQLGISQPEGA
jgi:phage terminase small subunit